MKVEIWSDIVCPFCYLGKIRFEKALQEFEGKERVEVTWKSFQLRPDMDPSKYKDTYQTLMDKGISREQAVEMCRNMEDVASKEDLVFDFDKSKVFNTLDALRLSHLARKYGLQDKVGELLFKGYFTDGLDLGKKESLQKVGEEAGIPKEEVSGMLNGTSFKEDVLFDINEAANFGIRGVPFFLINRKYGISGAQPKEVFADAFVQINKEEKEMQ